MRMLVRGLAWALTAVIVVFVTHRLFNLVAGDTATCIELQVSSSTTASQTIDQLVTEFFKEAKLTETENSRRDFRRAFDGQVFVAWTAEDSPGSKASTASICQQGRRISPHWVEVAVNLREKFVKHYQISATTLMPGSNYSCNPDCYVFCQSLCPARRVVPLDFQLIKDVLDGKKT